MTPPARFAQHHTVLAVARRPDDDEAGFARAAARLADLLRPALGEHAHATWRWLPAATVGVAVVHAGPAPPAVPDRFLWGHACAVDTDAPEVDVDAGLRDPASWRGVAGRWVLAGVGDGGVRLVTSATTTHTLRTTSGRLGSAWSTCSAAAAWLAGRVPAVDADRIGELLLFDHVLGDRDLLAGLDVLGDAAVVEVDARGTRTTSWWDLEERLAPGPPATPADLRGAVSRHARAWAGAPGAVLGLTAGRDSSLIASCLQAEGLRMPSFTLGAAGYVDVERAARTAAAVGLPHRAVVPVASASREQVLGRALLTGAGETIRNVMASGWDWDVEGLTWVSGHGGEVGRAFYWAEGGPDAARARLRDEATVRLGRERAACTIAAIDAELAAAEALGRRGAGALDTFYVRNRMRKWLGNTVPHRQIGDSAALYLHPEIVRVLLDLPEEERRTGRAFDAALAAGPEVLYRPHGPRRPGLATRLVRRIRPGPLPHPTAVADRQLDAAAALFPGDLRVRDLVGGEAWDRLQQRVRAREPLARRMHFNALAVEALLRALDGWPAAPA